MGANLWIKYITIIGWNVRLCAEYNGITYFKKIKSSNWSYSVNCFSQLKKFPKLFWVVFLLFSEKNFFAYFGYIYHKISVTNRNVSPKINGSLEQQIKQWLM